MIIAAIIGIIILTILIVWLIDKFVPKKLKPVINLVLWALIIFLGYITFMSVYKEIQFNQLKVERYKVVIDRLVDIRDSQVAYKEVKGEYAGSFDKLIDFVENDSIPITQRRDTLVLDEERTRAFGNVETMKTITLIDTLDYWNVKDSIFKGNSRYKSMADVGIGKPGAKFKLEAGKLDEIPVFEVSVDKAIVLDGQEKYLIDKEKQAVSIAGVKGESVKIGSMQEVNTSGNWGKDLSNKE
ncbi:hypothetical protein [Winogradskyella marincola]|uniref:Uncharacterized protein n=1 Tax=Winogradskyella marincola TaxID=3037795 RepID=A0ABT6G161_9FLAO|nr:hypothetical protein [Winogradskyella sp. YYF002]MDG4715774.1 hypothetical protein [Winogradskyella sp. YYF002]